MRTRKEIEGEVANRIMANDSFVGNLHAVMASFLEVLLDIRELLDKKNSNQKL